MFVLHNNGIAENQTNICTMNDRTTISVFLLLYLATPEIAADDDPHCSSEVFTWFARGANVLVIHMPVPESIRGTGKKLHAPPTIIGKIAAETVTGQWVLSHLMVRSPGKMKDNLMIR